MPKSTLKPWSFVKPDPVVRGLYGLYATLGLGSLERIQSLTRETTWEGNIGTYLVDLVNVIEPYLSTLSIRSDERKPYVYGVLIQELTSQSRVSPLSFCLRSRRLCSLGAIQGLENRGHKSLLVGPQKVAKVYEHILFKLGVDISYQKSLVSTRGSAEFAKRFQVRGLRVIYQAISIKNFSISIEPGVNCA
ncbi:mitovirus RNA-dependent RNA polymerase [Striga asiatica]|uniref:Mitovirus RNA-dependent RNA polymerase n=1 Tax=Striga asiatica TaxID=4170 RepID=A0A5A7Q1C4_STRAF|nr:mitovirus RNA-dependent RNA polymerase [Striga asiatica]